MEHKTCEHCGQEYELRYRVTRSYLAKRRFCSPACAHQALRGNRRATFGRERKTLEERFWSKVERGPECWLWRGSLDIRGYGVLGRTRRQPPLRAHRVSYELNIGPITAGMCVCHRCDVPACVNPAHLFLGTKADNAYDMWSKGRARPGGRSKFSKTDVEEMRVLYEAGMTQTAIAKRFGVSQVHVSRLVRVRV